MTISRFYSAIIGSRRAHAPTMSEARRDYRRAHEAQFAGLVGVVGRWRAR